MKSSSCAALLATVSDSRKMALKLHKQFAHPTAEKLTKLLKYAGMLTDVLEKEIKILSEILIFVVSLKSLVHVLL